MTTFWFGELMCCFCREVEGFAGHEHAVHLANKQEKPVSRCPNFNLIKNHVFWVVNKWQLTIKSISLSLIGTYLPLFIFHRIFVFVFVLILQPVLRMFLLLVAWTLPNWRRILQVKLNTKTTIKDLWVFREIMDNLRPHIRQRSYVTFKTTPVAHGHFNPD